MKTSVYARSKNKWSEQDALLDILASQNLREEQLQAEHNEKQYRWRVKQEKSSHGLIGFLIISTILTIGGNYVINYFNKEKVLDNITRNFEEVNLEKFKTDLIGSSLGNSDYKIVDVVIKKSNDDMVEGFFVIENENNNDSFQFKRDFQVSTDKIKGGDGFFKLLDNINQETLQNKVLNKYSESHIFTIPEIANNLNSDETFEFRFLDNNLLIFYNDGRQYEGTYSFTEIESMDNDNKELDFTNRNSLTNEDVETFLNTDSFSCSGKIKLRFKNDGELKEFVANFKTIDGGFLMKNLKMRNITDGSFNNYEEEWSLITAFADASPAAKE